ncbi:phage tail assembly chaperone [Xenophilus sp. Marseille-Q4582]|uniref:phage tail assembly chaperone n=1 Tax=Xenophilus sp. Marseille-Q4582 TaxID=2866600 RepID=UPI001CE3FABF|nr:phage tail assembly chaperone [Xenophilus sp. Marseille-Q4582]
MAKLSLTQKPTFEVAVEIPVPGGKPVPVKFKFKARTRDEFKEWGESIRAEERDDTTILMDILSGWELEDAFERENVEKLCQNYLGAARAIIDRYFEELTAARRGN